MLRRGQRRRLPKKRQSKYCGSLGVWGFRLWVVVKTCKQKIIIGNLGNTKAKREEMYIRGLSWGGVGFVWESEGNTY